MEHDYVKQNQVWEFCQWLKSKDLGPLEDVREYVEMYALGNCGDVPADQIFECAKATVLMYLDDTEAAEVFDYFRKK